MRGVVLCGGRATRLPYKIFLSQANGDPLFCSAIDCLLKKDMGVTLLINQDHETFIRNILGNISRYSFKDIRIVKDNYDGMIPALQRFGNTKDDLCVLCADNLYPQGWIKSLQVGIAYVSEGSDPSLDHYSPSTKRWNGKGYDESSLNLLTPWILPNLSKLDLGGMNVPDLLNHLQVEPYLIDPEGWYDLGTQESLGRYYASH